MAEFLFYGDQADSLAIAAGILADPSLKLLRSWNYPRRKAEEIDRDLTNFASSLALNKGMYVAGPFTTRIAWHKVGGGEEAGTYVISEWACGSLVSVRFPGLGAYGGQPSYNAGSVHIQSWYFAGIRRRLEPPSESLKAGYQLVVKIARRCCVKRRYAGRPLWVGRHLLELGISRSDIRLRLGGKSVLVGDLQPG